MNQEQKVLTQRIQLSPIKETEADELHQLWIQPEVRKYLWDDLIIPDSQTKEIVNQSISAFTNKKYGLWVARLLNQTNIIGFSGYWPFFTPPQIQLLYGLSPQYWGQGLATEMSIAMLDYGFTVYGFEEIYASTDLENKPSLAVLERLEMNHFKQENIDNKETVFYQKKLTINTNNS